MDYTSTNFMIGVLDNLPAPSSFLLDTFFPQVQTEASEEIHFDVLDRTRRLAPFVSPVVAGKVQASQGHTTKTFKPAYVKPKEAFDMNRPIKRAAGERIGGNMSPSQRAQMIMAGIIADQRDQIIRRLEVMASEALRTGKVTVSGDQYSTQVVDFGRHTDNTITLTSGSKWGESGVKPLADLNEWALEVLQRSGAKPTEVVMDTDAWTTFSQDDEVKDRLDTRRVNNAVMSMGGPAGIGGTYMGTIDGFNIWVYADWYIDPDDGDEKPVMPSNTVILGGQRVEGVRAFGAIRDESAGLQAMEMFPKSWVVEDPSVRYVMTQSAPLVVPTRVNHTFCATVG
ncbi:MAG: major capsid protein [Guyparkeria sp.]